MQFVKAQICLTRKCNLSCSYCSFSRKKFRKELSIDEWKKAILILDRIGIKFLKIMGGEPTIVRNLDKLITFIKYNTKINVAVFSNSFVSKNKLRSLFEAGIDQYITSIDVVDKSPNFSGDISKKSRKGLDALFYLKKLGLKTLRANIVVGKHNIADIPRIVGWLSKNGIYSSLSPVHTGIGDTWELRCKDSSLKLTEGDLPKIEKITKKLLEMKKKGALIANSVRFLSKWPKYATNLNWHCRFPPVLWVDADGSLMCCYDIRGKTSQLSVFDLNKKENLRKFVKHLKEDAGKCSGCFYNCQFDGRLCV